MKKRNFRTLPASVAIILTLATLPATAQVLGTTDDIHQLKYLNSLYIRSYMHSDTATYNRLLWAEDFVQQSSNGSLVTRKDCMIRFGQPRLHQILYFYADDVQVRFISNDVAMVYSKNPYAMKDGNRVIKGITQYNDVYVRRAGQWKCVSANITAIAPPSVTDANH
jgi:hypothetical protein